LPAKDHIAAAFTKRGTSRLSSTPWSMLLVIGLLAALVVAGAALAPAAYAADPPIHGSGDLSCAACHRPHQATLSRLLGQGPGVELTTQTDLCFNCHGAVGSGAIVQVDSEFVESVGSGHVVENAPSGGDLTNECSSCHGVHSAESALPGTTVNGHVVDPATDPNAWCLACHDTEQPVNWSGLPTADYDAQLFDTATLDAEGYPLSGTFRGVSAYASSMHAAIPAETDGRATGDCLWCHAEHRGPSQYDNLVADFGPSTPSDAGADVCFTCHSAGGGAADIESAVTGDADSGHTIKTAGGSLAVGASVPCYECHNPHGSKFGNTSMISDVRGDNLDVSTEEGQRKFCYTCHTVDGLGWDSGDQANAADGSWTAVDPGATAVGLGRATALAVPTSVGAHSGTTGGCSCHGETHSPTGGYDSATHQATLTNGWIPLFSNHDGMGSFGVGMNCADCHNAEIGQVHGNTCSTCHPTPRDAFADWSGSCSQVGCHTTYHDSGFDHGEIEDGNCSACHDEGSFDLYPDPCVSCHALTTTTDTTPPVTTTDTLPSYIGAARILLHATDDGQVAIATQITRLDGGPSVVGSSVDVPEPGTHTLEYWSVDQYGNTEAPQSVTFTVVADTVPPTTTSGAASAYEGPAIVALSATDASYLGVKATHFTLNGGAVQTGTTVSIPQPASGTIAYTLRFWSEDWAGNTETTTTANFTVTRDTTPPVSTLSTAEYYRTSTTFSIPFSAVDTGAGVQYRYYRVDGGTATSLPYWMTGIARAYTQGPHTIEYWSTDKVGNVEVHQFASFTVDWTLPTVSSDAVDTYPETGATITITASDGPANGSGFAAVHYRLNGGAEETGPATTVVSVPASGVHTLEYWALDNAGNSTAHTTKTFVVGAGGGANGIIRLVWADADISGYQPAPGDWAAWTIRGGGPTGPVVASGSASTSAGWTGIDDVVVPPTGLPGYYVYIDWWDAANEYAGPTIYSDVVVPSGGVVRLSY